MAAKHLFVANEIGLFDKLACGPATLDKLADSPLLAIREDRRQAKSVLNASSPFGVTLTTRDRRVRRIQPRAA